MIPLLHMGQASLRLTNKSPHAAQVHKWWHGAKMHPRWRSIQITHSASKAEAFLAVASSWIGAKFPAGLAKLGSEWLALELTYLFFLNNSARFFRRSSRCSSFKIKGSFPDLKKAVLPHRSSKLRPEKSASNKGLKYAWEQHSYIFQRWQWMCLSIWLVPLLGCNRLGTKIGFLCISRKAKILSKTTFQILNFKIVPLWISLRRKLHLVASVELMILKSLLDHNIWRVL